MEWVWWFWFFMESIIIKMAMKFIRKYTGSLLKQESLTQNICSPLTIESLKEIVSKSAEEVWAFTEMKNQVYSAQITIEERYLLLKSLSQRNPPESAVKIPYEEVKKLINRNNLTTFLEINPRQVDDSLDKVYLHIKLQGGQGRTKQFGLLCSGEENGISYANTTFLESFGNFIDPEIYPFALLGGMRNDGCDDALEEMTLGHRILKPITPGLVASNYKIDWRLWDFFEWESKLLTTRFVIYTKGDPLITEQNCIGQVVHGLNNIEYLGLQARIHEAKSILIDDCGIVLAREDILSTSSPITIEYLKEMAFQSTSGVWAVLKKKDKIYCAEIVSDGGYLLLKSLSCRTPPENSTTVPYHKVKNLVDRNNITTFLKIKFSEEDDSNFGNKFIHIKIDGQKGRHLQFEVMCTGEVDCITYAKTDFLEVASEDENYWSGICAGARSDGKTTELPGFNISYEDVNEDQEPGKVLLRDWSDYPTKFLICTETNRSKGYLIRENIGNVVFGMEYVHSAISIAKEKGPEHIKIDECGIVLD